MHKYGQRRNSSKNVEKWMKHFWQDKRNTRENTRDINSKEYTRNTKRTEVKATDKKEKWNFINEDKGATSVTRGTTDTGRWTISVAFYAGKTRGVQEKVQDELISRKIHGRKKERTKQKQQLWKKFKVTQTKTKNLPQRVKNRSAW